MSTEDVPVHVFNDRALQEKKTGTGLRTGLRKAAGAERPSTRTCVFFARMCALTNDARAGDTAYALPRGLAINHGVSIQNTIQYNTIHNTRMIHDTADH